MSSSPNTYTVFINAWCGHCGRRRSPDGNCPNCDNWYSTPLLTVGAPLVFALLLLMFIGIRVLQPGQGTLSSSGQPAPVAVATKPAPVSPSIPYVQPRPVVVAMAVPPVQQVQASLGMTEAEWQYQQIDTLRRTVAYNAATWEQNRYGSSQPAPVAGKARMSVQAEVSSSYNVAY